MLEIEYAHAQRNLELVDGVKASEWGACAGQCTAVNDCVGLCGDRGVGNNCSNETTGVAESGTGADLPEYVGGFGFVLQNETGVGRGQKRAWGLEDPYGILVALSIKG